MSQYLCGIADVHFNSMILSHAYYTFAQNVTPDVAGRVLYQVVTALGPESRYVTVANAFVNKATAIFPQNPKVAAGARQAFLVAGGMDHGPPLCSPATPPPPSQVAVPDMRGDSPAAASSALSAAGLHLGTQRNVVDNTCNDIGHVLSQIPSAGTRVAPGTAVDIFIGQRPAPPRSCP